MSGCVHDRYRKDAIQTESIAAKPRTLQEMFGIIDWAAEERQGLQEAEARVLFSARLASKSQRPGCKHAWVPFEPLRSEASLRFLFEPKFGGSDFGLLACRARPKNLILQVEVTQLDNSKQPLQLSHAAEDPQ